MQWQATTILDGSSGSESVTAPQLHLASPIGKVSHRLQAEFSSRDTTRCPQPVHIEHKACPQRYPPKHTVSIQGFAGLFPQGRPISARLDGYLPGLYPRFSNGTLFAMRNGLYSLQMHMLDGVKGRDSGVIILRDGKLIGGGPYFWSIGTYTVGDGTWKGQFTTNQHTPLPDRFARPLAGGQEVTSGFSGTFTDDGSEVFGTSLVGTRSLGFRATLKRLADD
jgi:hypothetical protein